MADHLASTTATPSTCHRCGASLLTALDEGIRARVDATPLTDTQAEIAALLAGLRTYTHQAKQLIHRDAYRIAAQTLTGRIHAEHQCPPRPVQSTIYDIGETA